MNHGINKMRTKHDEYATVQGESIAAFSQRWLRPLNMQPACLNEYSISGADTLSLDQPFRRLRIEVLKCSPGDVSWFSRAAESVNALLSLRRGWDSYGALPTSEHAARKAVDILIDLVGEGARMPAIVPASNGGIQLEWHNSGRDVEIEIDATGAVTAYVEGDGFSNTWTTHQLLADPRSSQALSAVVFAGSQ